MSTKSAQTRYMVIFIPAMIAYAFILVGVIYLLNSQTFEQPIQSLIAIAPAVPMLIVWWAMMRFMRETDEFMRSMLAKHLLTGLSLVILAAFIYGFGEEFANWPHIPLFMVLPYGFFFMGVSQLWDYIRVGRHHEK